MEYKAFKDLTKEERSEIVEAKLRGEVEWHTGLEWEVAGSGVLVVNATYRIKPAKKLDIPWEIIKPEYKWAAMDECGDIAIYDYKPVAADDAWLCGNNGHGNSLEIHTLKIDTTGISWENSLTQRPEGI